MVALHGTNPVTVYLSARARVPAATVEAVDEALYGSRAIVRMLGVRHTVFVVPAPLFPVVQRACTEDVRAAAATAAGTGPREQRGRGR